VLRQDVRSSIIIGLSANAALLFTPLGIIFAVDLGLREAHALLLVGHPAGISSAFSIIGILSPVTSRIIELSAFSAGVELREGITIQTDPSGLGCAHPHGAARATLNIRIGPPHFVQAQARFM